MQLKRKWRIKVERRTVPHAERSQNTRVPEFNQLFSQKFSHTLYIVKR